MCFPGFAGGGLIATGIGYYVEIEFSSAAGLVVFLTLFFAKMPIGFRPPAAHSNLPG